MNVRLCAATEATLLSETSVRDGETKLGQQIQILSCTGTDFGRALLERVQSGARYAVIGIPEDIGARANLGRAGAERAWEAFLPFFVNMQCNSYLDGKRILLLGHVDLSDIKKKETECATAGGGKASVNDLRALCAEIDDRVHPLIEQIVAAGLEPIVIGGGNNNSLPTIKGVVHALRRKTGKEDLGLCTVNCDPHADFRRLEGRHSGNPFSYADNAGLLKAYCVVGAHENFNSEDMLERLKERGYPISFLEQVVRGEETWQEQVQRAIDYLSASGMPMGVELDLDGIEHMPSSAKTPFGISAAQAFHYIYRVASSLDVRYLHLSEAAPQHGDDGGRFVGKVLAKAVAEYVRARESFQSALVKTAA